MLTISKWKSFSIIGFCVLSLLFAFPNMVDDETLDAMPEWLQSTINLGLELQGGSHLKYEINFNQVNKDYLSKLLKEVRKSLRSEKIRYKGLSLDRQATTPSISLEVLSEGRLDDVKKAIRTVDKDLLLDIKDSKVLATLTEETFEKRRKDVIEQTIEVIRKRIDEHGTKEPSILREGQNRIVIDFPGVDNPAAVKKLIGKTAKMTFHKVNDERALVSSPSASVPSDTSVMEEMGTGRYLAVKKEIMVDGMHLVNAMATTDENGRPAVSLKFNAIGARQFAKMSAQFLKKQFAIVLDNKVISAPVFQSVIPNGDGVITGSFTFKEAHDLALLLRAGALPAPLKILEERTVGPSLGADSIKDGQTATILAFILVSIFMLLAYSVFGFFANVALFFNFVILFAGLGLLEATLTLPGIAGIALTLGMAVDANVLIYERIREEIRAGVRPIAAIDAGYRRAMTTILDSNLTTLLGAAVLYEFGSGPIRGFAVTLSLGIIISMFTALSLTRLIVIYWLRHRKSNAPLSI